MINREFVKTNINTLLGIILMSFSAIRTILYFCDYVFVPFSYTLYYILLIAVSFCLVKISKYFEAEQTSVSQKFGCIMPLIVILYFVSSILTTEFDVIYNPYVGSLMPISAIVGFMCAGGIMFTYLRNKFLRFISHIAYGIAIFAALYFLFFSVMSFFLSTSSVPKIIEKIDSPDQTYTLVLANQKYVKEIDKYVSLWESKKDIFLLTGNARKKSESVLRTENDISISWKDDKTFIINGISYDAENVLKYPEFPAERYLHTMGVYVPKRYPDEYYDWYFPLAQGGDGRGTAVYKLSKEEMDAIMADVQTNSAWQKIGEKRNPTFGREEEMIPMLHSGYYCITDKYGNPIESESMNYILCLFSDYDNTLWFYTSDS